MISFHSELFRNFLKSTALMVIRCVLTSYVSFGDICGRKRGNVFFVQAIVFLLAAFVPARPCVLSVQGDIYSFKDENGVVHVSNVPVDTRYRFKQKEKIRKIQDSLYEIRRKRYDSLIKKIAKEKGLDPDLLRAVVEVESYYDPNAVSSKGAMGLMQLMPETARELGVVNPFDPDDNLKGGAQYLRRLIEKYVDRLPLALAAYNAGETAVDRYQKIPPYPETQNYVRKVLEKYNKKKATR